jgi:hypothetical protein
LSPTQRTEVLKSHVKRYGKGGWRGLHVPSVQVHRFASADLDRAVQELWRGGVENSKFESYSSN